MNWAKITARRDEKKYVLGLGAAYITELTVLSDQCNNNHPTFGTDSRR